MLKPSNKPDFKMLAKHLQECNESNVAAWLKRVYEMGFAAGNNKAWDTNLKLVKEKI